MSKLGIILVTVALTGFGVTEAQARTLATAPAAVGETGQIIHCDIVSLEKKAKEVTIEILQYNGTVNSSTTITLDPNTGGSLGSVTSTSAWCRFTITGSPKKYRAIAVYENGLAYTLAIPAQ